MLKEIKIENYKAFETAELQIKPITILLGANSIGKSSIMQLILLIKQTINYRGLNDSALKLNGEYVNLGEPENIFRNLKTDKPIFLSFKLDDKSGSVSKNHFNDEIKRRILSLHRELLFMDTYIQSKLGKSLYKRGIKEIDGIIYGSDTDKRSVIQMGKELIKNYKKFKKDFSEIEKIKSEKIRDEINLNVSNIADRIEKIDIKGLRHTSEFLNSFEDLDLKEITYLYQIAYSNDNTLVLNSLKIYADNDKLIMGYSNEKSKNGRIVHRIFSDLIDDKILDIYRIFIGQKLNLKMLKISLIEESNTRNLFDLDNDLFATIFIKTFTRFLRPINDSLSQELINYVGPLRAYPKRYYFLDGANISSSFNTIRGEELAEILKENQNIKKKVNMWLSNFGFEINVDKLQDVIHNLKVNQSGLKLDITDVGFGISQILPVIVQGFLAQKDSLTLIEQPEIHLHPKMQAELADLFIDIVKNDGIGNKNLIIETHSEYLLRRLRRRISEKKISNEYVAIYFIKKEKKNSIIEKVDISASGAFDWPEEFYIDELDDTIAFIKNQPAE